jgi:hypothetical protein
LEDHAVGHVQGSTRSEEVMSDICGAEHPDEPIVCDRPPGNHQIHSGLDESFMYQDWPNEAYTPPLAVQERSVRTKLAEAARRTREAHS